MAVIKEYMKILFKLKGKKLIKFIISITLRLNDYIL